MLGNSGPISYPYFTTQKSMVLPHCHCRWWCGCVTHQKSGRWWTIVMTLPVYITLHALSTPRSRGAYHIWLLLQTVASHHSTFPVIYREIISIENFFFTGVFIQNKNDCWLAHYVGYRWHQAVHTYLSLLFHYIQVWISVTVLAGWSFCTCEWQQTAVMGSPTPGYW
jgi:hypothetical protein